MQVTSKEQHLLDLINKVNEDYNSTVDSLSSDPAFNLRSLSDATKLPDNEMVNQFFSHWSIIPAALQASVARSVRSALTYIYIQSSFKVAELQSKLDQAYDQRSSAVEALMEQLNQYRSSDQYLHDIV